MTIAILCRWCNAPITTTGIDTRRGFQVPTGWTHDLGDGNRRRLCVDAVGVPSQFVAEPKATR
jgi:hypothetical protein